MKRKGGFHHQKDRLQLSSFLGKESKRLQKRLGLQLRILMSSVGLNVLAMALALGLFGAMYVVIVLWLAPNR